RPRARHRAPQALVSGSEPGTGGDGPAEEHPSAFPDEPPEEVPALDEAPDGHSPGEANERDEDSLPPG
ncbi:MAG TPA: hypothetical protein VK007_01260, partial [Acidimicrobiales bacterium]|nr:hypothetical protein [Acidimicrobiales bacterium]